MAIIWKKYLKEDEWFHIVTGYADFNARILEIEEDTVLVMKEGGDWAGVDLSQVKFIEPYHSSDRVSKENQPLIPIQNDRKENASVYTEDVVASTPTEALSIDMIYKKALNKATYLSTQEEWTILRFKEYLSVCKNDYLNKNLLSIYNSVNYSMNKDLSSLNSKINEATHKLSSLYESYPIPELLYIGAFLQTLNVDKSLEENGLYKGVQLLLKYGSSEMASGFVLSNGRLPDVLSVWKDFFSAPHILIKVFNKGITLSSFYDLLTIRKYLEQICTSSVHDIEGKNLLIYSLYKILIPNAGSLETACDDKILSENLKTLIDNYLSSYLKKGRIVLASSKRLISQEYELYTYNDSFIKVSMGDEVEFFYNKKDSVCTITGIISQDDEFFTSLRNYLDTINLSDYPSLRDIVLPCKAFIESYLKQHIVHTPSKKAGSTPIASTLKNKPATDYSVITSVIQGAKTYEERLEAIDHLLKYIQDNGPRANVVNDLISLYLRKPNPDYDKAVEIFEEYRNTIEEDPSSKLKLYRIAVTAFIAKSDNKTAQDLLEYILSVHESIPDYVKLARCNLKLHNYNKALDCCIKAEKMHNILLPDAVAIIVCKYAAHLAMEDYEKAKEDLNDFSELSNNLDKIAQMESLLKDRRNSLISKEECAVQIDGLIQSVTLEQTYSIKRLYEPYLKEMLDTCQFEGIRDRIRDKKTNLWTWRPKSPSGSLNIYKDLENNSYVFLSRTGGIRDAVIGDAANKYLSMAKIAELTLLKSVEWGFDDDQAEEWRTNFLCAAARYLWLTYQDYSREERVKGEKETCIFYLKECICTYVKSDVVFDKYDFYDAFNMYFCRIVENDTFKKTPLRRNYSTITDEKRLQLRNIIYSNILMSWKTNEDQTLKAMGLLAANSIKATDFLLSLLKETEVTTPLFPNMVLKKLSILMSDSEYESTDKNSLETLLQKYGLALATNRNQIINGIISLTKAIYKRDTQDILVDIRAVKRLMSNDLDCYLLNKDISRCNYYLDLIGGDKDSLIILIKNINNYEIGQNNYVTIKTKATQLLHDINNEPTEIAYFYLRNSIEKFLEVAETIENELVSNSEPILRVNNEYDEEGYVPVNNTLEAMFLISNGKKGENCTTASQVTIDIHEKGLEKYCKLSKTHYEIFDSIGKGEQKSVKIPLILTKEGSKPDSVLPFSCTIGYLTIVGKHKEEVFQSNLRINSDKAFAEIANLYGESPIKPEDRERAHLFKGRDKDIENICGDFSSSLGGQTVLIYGQYRSGKSTLKYFVVNKMKHLQKDIIVADALSVISTDTASDIAKSIINCIYRELNKRELLVANIDNFISDEDDFYCNYSDILVRFTNLLKDNMVDGKPLHGKKILVVLDEFGRFLENNESTSFIETWKTVMEINAFNALFIGHDVVTQMMRRDINAFGVIRLRRVDYIDIESARALIIEPTFMKDKHKSRFTEEAVNYICKESGGNVFYLQLICFYAVQFMNRRKINILNELYVKQAIEQWIDSIDPPTAEVLGHPLFKSGEIKGVTDDMAKIVLDAICSTSGNSGLSGTIEDIQDYVQSNYSNDINNEEVFITLTSLLSRKVIERNNERYVIRAVFYKDYLNKKIMMSFETGI